MPSTTVYAVDDDPDVLASLRFLLETEGFAVKTFANGPDLLASSLPGPSDCLVIDYRMTGMDGLELVRHLRDRDVSSPILLVTVFEGIAAKAAASGIRYVVMKPLMSRKAWLRMCGRPWTKRARIEGTSGKTLRG
jgi:FixJ family two-component response regulator